MIYSDRPRRAAAARVPSFSYSASVKEAVGLFCGMEVSGLRKRNTLAAALLVASLAFGYLWRWVVGPALLHRPTITEPQPAYAVASVGLLTLGLCFLIQQGKRWAAWVFAFVFALEVVLPALDYQRLLGSFQREPLTLVPFAATYLLEGWALWLLFK